MLLRDYDFLCRACKCTDPETGELRRFGFVDFADYGVVRKVMNITKHYIKVSRDTENETQWVLI